ncbi:competence protein ComEA [Propionicimonas paludicola]|uniref:Competence protein ComEA n=1 Tax=Propionicimonas paludicola TaxID=185243 RepID=A0A2A9CR95_9ACTN|nr:competence protein ComEA [Propionicimonas paludicola]
MVRARLEHLLSELEPAVTGEPRRAWAPKSSSVPSQEPAVPVGESAAGAGVAASAPAVVARVLSFGREHLVAVVLILVVGTVWTGYSLFQARTTPVAAAVAPTILAMPTPTPTPTPSPASVLVHVLGSVHRPGVVQLDEGSRVQDAIAAAGGLTGDADPGELNLAAVLVDGSQLKIGTKKHPGGELRSGATGEPGSPAGGAAEAKISLNTATVAQLDTLPGIGPVTAQKILDWRTEHGKYTAITELQEVDGIGPKTYADLAARVRL